MYPDPPIEGEQMLLACRGMGVQLLGWTKNDQDPPNNNPRIRYYGAVIVIVPARLSDSGCYRCYGRNAGQNLTTALKVLVTGEATYNTWIWSW